MTDQGSTYASRAYQEMLIDNKLRSSMSRKGECLDNAVAESFFGTLKNEHVYFENYKSREQARQSIFEYIEAFYNRKRRHAFLNYMTPVEFEKNMLTIKSSVLLGETHSYFGCNQQLKLDTHELNRKR